MIKAVTYGCRVIKIPVTTKDGKRQITITKPPFMTIDETLQVIVKVLSSKPASR